MPPNPTESPSEQSSPKMGGNLKKKINDVEVAAVEMVSPNIILKGLLDKS